MDSTLNQPMETQSPTRVTFKPGRKVTGGVFLLFYALLLAVSPFVAYAFCIRNAWDFTDGLGPWGSGLMALLPGIVGITFAVAGVRSSIRWAKGGRWSMYEVLVVAYFGFMVCAVLGMWVYIWFFEG